MTWEPDQILLKGFPGSACNAGEAGTIPEMGRSPGEEWLPTQVCLPGEVHGQRARPNPINKKLGHSPKEKICLFCQIT